MRRSLVSFAIASLSVGTFAPSAFAMTNQPPPRTPPVVVQPKPRPKPAVAIEWVIVQSGDTLSGIGVRVDRSWQALGAYNQVADPNLITAGQRFRIPPVFYQPPGGYGAIAVAPAPISTAESAPASPAQPVQTQALAASSGGSAVGGSFGACVRQRESGGNYQVTNSSGHYGAYQFSASAWAEFGGSPSAFGNASPAEQDQVFANAMARGAESAWTPYDGCTG